MLNFWIYLYKLTGYCPSWLVLRTYKYAMRRLHRMCQPGYYIGHPFEALEYWIGDYQMRIGLHRPAYGIWGYIKLFKYKLEVKWKTMI